MSDTALAVRPPVDVAEYDVQDLVGQVQKIQEAMKVVMKEGEHYGKIPGCGDKPSLLKPGAEKIGFMFRLAPRFHGEREPIDLGNGHREYVIRSEYFHIPTGLFVGEGLGSCNTMEAKYRYRTGPKEFTGQPVPKEYWDQRKSNPAAAQAMIGGPGYSVGKTESGIWEICIQGEKVEHDNPADYYNTVLKMAKKRSQVDGILTVTAASDFFTQDIEDNAENGVAGNQTTTGQAQAPKQQNGAAMPQRRSESAPAPTQSQPAGTPRSDRSADQRVITEKMEKRFWAICHGSGIPEPTIKEQIKAYGYEKASEIKSLHYDALCKWAEGFGKNPSYATSEPEPPHSAEQSEMYGR